MAEEDLQHERPTFEESAHRQPPSPERLLDAELDRASESSETGATFVQTLLHDAQAQLQTGESLAAGEEYEDAQLRAREITREASQELATLATTAETAIAHRVESDMPKAQEAAASIEGHADVFTDATQALERLVADFAANQQHATPDMVKRLRDLMVKMHPDKFPQDPRVASFASLLGRLKMAFGGDASAWKNPRGGGTFEEDVRALTAKGSSVETDATEVEAPSTALAIAETASVQEEVAERAFESEEEKDMHVVLGDIYSRMDQRIAGRMQELDGLYAKPERSAADQARIDELEYANGIDRKRKDLRKAQLECMLLKKQQEEIAAKIAQLNTELQPYEGAQDQNLLAVSAEAGRTLAIPGVDKRQELQAALTRLLAEKEAIDKQFEGRVALIADLRDTMAKLAELLLRAKQGQESSGSEQEKPTTSVAAETSAASGGMGGYAELAPSGQEKKPNILEKVIDYAASPFEKWLDFTFDPDGSSKAAIARMTQWAKELGEAKPKSKQKKA